MNPKITHIDTACCLIEIEGFKILTDPTLDEAGKLYHHGFGAISKKTESPIINKVNLQDVDLILLSHPQHKDNFDLKGREFAKGVPLIISTQRIEKQFKNGKGLKPWESYEIEFPNTTKRLKVTATPAQHHPNWLPKFISGEVIGFFIETNQSHETIYISGDTIFFRGINEIVKKLKPITYALIHVGSAQFRYLTGLGKFTMDAKGFIETITKINPKIAIPIHNGGWAHFKENDDGIKRQSLTAKPEIRQKIHFLERGKPTELKLLTTQG